MSMSLNEASPASAIRVPFQDEQGTGERLDSVMRCSVDDLVDTGGAGLFVVLTLD